MSAAYQRTLKAWAADFRAKLDPKIRTLISQANFDLYHGPVQDGAWGDPTANDPDWHDYPGFTKACKQITSALTAAKLPSKLYFDTDMECWQEKEPEGKIYDECDGQGQVECEIGFGKCATCYGRGEFDPGGDWWKVDRKELLSAIVGTELVGYL